ncbi:DEAD/DEAH box helicase, partial [Candidatus Woesearchaeota archaeon]
MIKRIQAITNDPVVDLALDTLKLGKQCLIFVNTKRSAEHCAEVISTQIKDTNLKQLADKVISVLPQPTSQCRRLSRCVLRGVAFHHAGLHPRQKELVEENFRKGVLKIICCTTTMAAGVDLPAFRSIIRDLKRYGHRGMEFIPILEYHQAAGRAGRPGKEEYGESIAIARSEGDKEEIIEMFIKGKPERIYSKLAVEPVLRTYLLSLVATGIAKSQEELLAFFSKTFWAKQYEDMSGLSSIILKVLGLLKEWGFIEGHENGFVSAGDLGNSRLRTTPLGKRVAELYLDPLTAHHLVEGLRQARAANLTEFSWLQLICSTLEMRPLLRVRTREFDNYQEML